ncbi:hypothetical protein PR202_ga04025 [Eleusine coracana subsp. coracana]|uniref:Phytosulfokine n=1 Tax=Eleusine coracana subsp. coracana TaxID=191504 RepID=A0AAV5BQQ5_ELECO|nr:hypothetical protein PR202_ga04025 [Eleusine coracana subsp. coracana]
MARYRRTSAPPLAALAGLLLLTCFVFHCGAAARPLPAPLVDGLLLQEGAAGNGDELSISEMMGAEEAEACEEGNDECMQRRLLRDAHLDYIYTQHKGKP